MESRPEKLTPDPIAEALIEVRFSSQDLPEAVIGRLSSNGPFRGRTPVRLPVGEIPLSIRSMDLNLKYQPTIEFKDLHNASAIRIGESVLSWHRVSHYPGWRVFVTEITEAFSFLYKSLEDLRITRIGMKYVNVLSPDHFIGHISDLEMKLSVSGKDLASPLNLNYIRMYSESHQSLVRVASPEFVSGLTPGATALIDIDVFTPEGYHVSDFDSAIRWADSAHDCVKDEFFSLMPGSTLSKLGRGSDEH